MTTRQQVEVRMSRDSDWAVFEKACEITASAVRGALGPEGSQHPSYVGDVFRETFRALKETADALPDRGGKAGF